MCGESERERVVFVAVASNHAVTMLLLLPQLELGERLGEGSKKCSQFFCYIGLLWH